MMPTNIDDLIANLQQQEAGLAAARIAWNDKASRTQATFHDTALKLSSCICGLTSAPREIEAEETRIAKLERERAIVLTKQTELEQQIADAPDWRLVENCRQRDAEFARQQTLKMQLQKLREGTLLNAPNWAYPRIEDLDARLKQSHERSETLRAQLAEHLRQAEALLAGTVTS